MQTPTTEDAEGLLTRVEWRHSGRKAMRAAIVVVGILGVLALLATAGVKFERPSQFQVGKSGITQLDLATVPCFPASAAKGGHFFTPNVGYDATKEQIIYTLSESALCGSIPTIVYHGKTPTTVQLFALRGDQRTTYTMIADPTGLKTQMPTTAKPAPVCASADDVAKLTAAQAQTTVTIVNPELGGCCWMADTNAWAPDFGAASNIDEDDGAMPVADADACGSICAKDQRCQCAVYYEHNPVQWGHGNKKCWRRTECNKAGVHTIDEGYQTCILSG